MYTLFIPFVNKNHLYTGEIQLNQIVARGTIIYVVIFKKYHPFAGRTIRVSLKM